MWTQDIARFLILPCLLRSAWAATSNSSSSTACNNSPLLCDRAYNNITYLGAHDSPFLRDSSTDYSTSGNQFYNSTVQLNAGVRLLTAQVYSSDGEWHLCHTSCSLLDAGTLSSWLGEIGTWLKSNPDDVVTVLLVNSDSATASELAAQYQTAGVEDYCYTPESTSAPSTWPTLQTLINNGTRLLNFVATLDDNSDAPYLMDEFTYIFENNYDNSSPSNFSCTANRPSSVDGDTSAALQQNLMPLMNHFLYDVSSGLIEIETPDVDAVSTTNAPSGGGTGNLGDAATTCKMTYGKAPQYLLVDFFNAGPAIETVDSLNGVTDPVGRTNVTTSSSETSSSSSSSSGAGHLGVSEMAVALALVASTVAMLI